MSVLHLNVLPPPAHPDAPSPVVTRTSMRSGPGYRVTASDTDGNPVVSVWDASPTTAWKKAEAYVRTLASIATQNPDGVPFERRRAS